MKVTAKSPANIAFIKFWGKKDPKINLPFNDSISMNLSGCQTITTVSFETKFKTDTVVINGKQAEGEKKKRVVRILDMVRKMSGYFSKAEVISENNFPADAGIASSASSFSALALAASKAVGLNLNINELSILARKGSGSACRSIPDGFVLWKKGHSDATSYAVQLVPAEYWDIRDIVTVVSGEGKKTSSTEGHEIVTSSPYFTQRQKLLPSRIRSMKESILGKNFAEFGRILEEEAVDLHVIAMTSKPPIFYWNEGTLQVMKKLQEWREEGLMAFFTMDAGANVHVICQASDEKEINKRLKKLPLVLFTIVNSPAAGARLV